MEIGRLLGHFSLVIGAMTSEKSGNPDNTSYSLHVIDRPHTNNNLLLVLFNQPTKSIAILQIWKKNKQTNKFSPNADPAGFEFLNPTSRIKIVKSDTTLDLMLLYRH